MNNELICTPVMLSASEKTVTQLHTVGNLKTIRLSKEMFNMDICNPQHLYLVSEQEIKEDEWYIYNGDIYKATKSVLLAESLNAEVLNIKTINKIVATTDKSLSLPLIPSSFIEEWVNKQGKIDEVRVKMTNKPTMMSTTLGKFVPMENANEEVIILPVEDKTFNLSDMEKAFEGGYMEGDTGKSYRSSFFKTWLDSHY